MRVDLSLCKMLPNTSGCYVIWYRDVALYVGQTINLKRRWGNHQHKDVIDTLFPNSVFEAIPLPLDVLDEEEKRLIKDLRPIINNRDGSDFIRILGAPGNWWSKNFQKNKWFSGEEERYNRLKEFQENCKKVEMKHVALH